MVAIEEGATMVRVGTGIFGERHYLCFVRQCQQIIGESAGDYMVAIEEGATMVRVGTGIFGERYYQK